MPITWKLRTFHHQIYRKHKRILYRILLYSFILYYICYYSLTVKIDGQLLTILVKFIESDIYVLKYCKNPNWQNRESLSSLITHDILFIYSFSWATDDVVKHKQWQTQKPSLRERKKKISCPTLGDFSKESRPVPGHRKFSQCLLLFSTTTAVVIFSVKKITK